MENEVLSNFTENEKIALFDITLDLAKANSTTFASQIDSVINAFMIRKKEEKEHINMAPGSSFADPFKMDMSPSSNFANPFDMDMIPQKQNTASDIFDGPTLEPIDTQNINTGINM